MALPATTRTALRVLLGIKQSGHTSVETIGGGISTLTSDGVTVEDLAFITKEKLMSVLGVAEGEFGELWKRVVEKADTKLSEVAVQPVSTGDNSALNIKHEESTKEAVIESEATVSGGNQDKPEGGETAQALA